MVCPPRFVRSLTLLAALSIASTPLRAHAEDGRSAAKAEYQKATAAYGLGNYVDAAAHYEKAFELRADQALLYNAAQAHRLGGNKSRAVLLYRNYLRLYPRGVRRQDASRHLADLEAALAAESGPKVEPSGRVEPPPAVASLPVATAPVAPPVVTGAGAPPLPSPKTAPAAGTSVIVETPAPSPDTGDRRSLLSSPWLWVGVGVVAALVVGGVLVARSPRMEYPMPNLGRLNP